MTSPCTVVVPVGMHTIAISTAVRERAQAILSSGEQPQFVVWRLWLERTRGDVRLHVGDVQVSPRARSQ